MEIHALYDNCDRNPLKTSIDKKLTSFMFTVLRYFPRAKPVLRNCHKSL